MLLGLRREGDRSPRPLCHDAVMPESRPPAAELAPTVTDADRGAWERAEALTDTLLAPAYEALTAAEADALVTGTAAMAAAIAT